MKKTIIKVLSLAFVAFMLFSFDVPLNWFKAGSMPDSYNMFIDKGQGPDGKNAASIKSIDEHIKGFGTLMQASLPGKYLGHRVKMTGYMKSAGVWNWAGLWFRVDQVGSENPLSFDNMHDRPIKGTTDWKKCEIILDVPKNASMLAYGALLDGVGQIWFANITFQIVDDNTKPTTQQDLSGVLSEPDNLDFSK